MANEKRLIDANAIKYRKKDEYCGNGNSRPVRYVFDEDIAELPTVDAVEVVHGEWEKYTDDRFIGYVADGRIRYRKVYSYMCSKCRNYTTVKHKYCPNCGAKMDRGNEDG
jgi:hypothetical protein